MLTSSKRLVVKIGSSILVDEKKGEIRGDWLKALAHDVARLHSKGCEIVLVSSGAIRLGRAQLRLASGALKLEESQAAAATGQIRLARITEAHDYDLVATLLPSTEPDFVPEPSAAPAVAPALIRIAPAAQIPVR